MVSAIAIVIVEILLEGAIDQGRCFVDRAVFDPLAIDREADQFGAPIDLFDRSRRNQDLLPRPPILGVDHQVMDAPVVFLHQEVLDMADFAVAGVNVIAGHRLDAAQMRIAVVAQGAVQFFLMGLLIQEGVWVNPTPMPP